MAYSCLLGTSQTWDAVAYSRALTEDDTTPFTVPDTRYQLYVEAIAEDFSRFVPLDYTVGNVTTQTSPWLTVANQAVYICNSSNGFTVPPMGITSVLYQATNAFSAASEISYLALLPYSPLNRFLFTPSLLDSPSERILRDEYLAELDHYGIGFYAIQRDPATGLLAIALYPTPATGGVPLFAQYRAGHVDTGTAPVLTNGSKYLTVPEDLKRVFGNLLFARVLEEEGDRLAKAASARAGMLEVRAGNPEVMEQKVQRVRNEAYAELGGNVPVAIHSF